MRQSSKLYNGDPSTIKTVLSCLEDPWICGDTFYFNIVVKPVLLGCPLKLEFEFVTQQNIRATSIWKLFHNN